MMWDYGNEGARVHVTFGTYRELLERSRSFDSMAVMRVWQPTLSGQAQPERFDGQRVSASYFRTLGVSPAIGTDFQESDDRPNGPTVVIISDRLWRQRFNEDAAILGQKVTLDSRLYTVIGVMPRAFENVLAPAAELWTLLQYDPSLLPDSREWGHHLRMVGRLRSGADPRRPGWSSIQSPQNPAPEFSRPPHASMNQGLIVNSLQDDVTSGVKPALLAVLGAVAAGARDRLRECDESAAGSRRTATRRVCDTCRAGRGKNADYSAIAHRKPVARGPGRRAGNGRRGIRCTGACGA